jgi:hypothetical protein
MLFIGLGHFYPLVWCLSVDDQQTQRIGTLFSSPFCVQSHTSFANLTLLFLFPEKLQTLKTCLAEMSTRFFS